MKIQFATPIPDGDVTRQSLTVDYHVVNGDSIQPYPTGKTLPVVGLTEADKAIFDSFMDMLARNHKDEWETGAVTARVKAKAAAEIMSLEAPNVEAKT